MKEIRKILIIRNDHIGDFVLSTAVFRELRKKYPKSKIVLITSKINIPLIEKNDNINEIWELEIPQYNLSTILKYIKTSLKIRKEKFDVGIDLRGSILNTIFLLWLSGIKNRISRTDAHPIISIFLTNPISLNKKDHIIKQNAQIIEKGLNINFENWNPEIKIDKEDIFSVNNFIKKNKLKKYICIYPIVNLKYKQWSLNNFERLIKWLRKYNLKILLFGTKKDEKMINHLKKYNKNCLSIINFNLRQMPLLFKKSSLVIAQDGGPMHIAGASNSRLIALIPNFSDITYKIDPLGKNTVIIRDSDRIKVFTKRNVKKDSLNKISFEKVKWAIEKILDKD